MTSNNKSIKRTMMKTIKGDLFSWICEKDAFNAPLNRALLREKALELSKIHGVDGFKCSEAWLTNFLREHGFSTHLADLGGPCFRNYQDWINLMRSTITRYKHKDLYHADELTMYSDVHPTTIASLRDEDPEESGSTKNQITVLMCSNSTGTTKLPLWVCGSYPGRITTQDHFYCQTKDSRITDDLFRDWLRSLNNFMSRYDRKILLFLRRSRAAALKDFALSNVNLAFFPEDFPPFLRPLRRDVFHYVKMIYRREYAKRMERYPPVWTIHDMLNTLIESWEKVPREIIIYSFQRTNFRTDDCFLEINCDSWQSLHSGISFKRFVTFDDDLSDGLIKDKCAEKHRNHSYNLRPSCRQAIHLEETNLHSAMNEEKDKTEGKSRGSSRNASEQVRKGRVEWIVNREVDRTAITNCEQIQRDKDNCEKSDQFDEMRVLSDEERKSEKRVYVESKYTGGSQSGDQSHEGNKSVERVLPFKDDDVAYPRAMGRDFFKRKGVQREGTRTFNIRGSTQVIIDKALTMTSTAKADYARRLIDTIYASNEEARRNASKIMRSEFTGIGEESSRSSDKGERKNMEASNQGETATRNRTNEGSANVEKNFENLSLGSQSSYDNWTNNHLCEPSTSADCQENWSESREKRLGEKSEDQMAIETSSSKLESDIETASSDRGRNQDPDCTINLNEDNSRSSIHGTPAESSARKRWKSSNEDGSKDDSIDTQPLEKRTRTDCNWSKVYETNFVFGSPRHSESSSSHV